MYYQHVTATALPEATLYMSEQTQQRTWARPLCLLWKAFFPPLSFR